MFALNLWTDTVDKFNLRGGIASYIQVDIYKLFLDAAVKQTQVLGIPWYYHLTLPLACSVQNLPQPPFLMLLLTMHPYLISTLHPFPDIGRHVIPRMECRHLLTALNFSAR